MSGPISRILMGRRPSNFVAPGAHVILMHKLPLWDTPKGSKGTPLESKASTPWATHGRPKLHQLSAPAWFNELLTARFAHAGSLLFFIVSMRFWVEFGAIQPRSRILPESVNVGLRNAPASTLFLVSVLDRFPLRKSIPDH